VTDRLAAGRFALTHRLYTDNNRLDVKSSRHFYFVSTSY